MEPQISVIMSVYNGETYLEEAIMSVVNQTFKNWELIVINDCSTDKTAEILKELAEKDQRIKVYTNEVNLKLPASLNKAISLSSGKYIARMDADDICLPDRFYKQFEFMESHPEVSLSSPKFMTVKNGTYAPGAAGGRCDSDAINALLLVANPILHPGVIAKADVMKKYNYDTTLTCTEDLELWTRMVMNGEKLEILPECLLIYRLHDKQITSTTLERQHTEVLKIEEKYYAAVAEELAEGEKDFYISGIYFKENANVEKFLKYAKWLKFATKSIKKAAVKYALFETLAEYKRHNINKNDVIKAMLKLGPIFVAKEIIRRKFAAKRDIKNCLKVAETIGIKRVGGTAAYPIFEQE